VGPQNINFEIAGVNKLALFADALIVQTKTQLVRQLVATSKHVKGRLYSIVISTAALKITAMTELLIFQSVNIVLGLMQPVALPTRDPKPVPLIETHLAQLIVLP